MPVMAPRRRFQEDLDPWDLDNYAYLERLSPHQATYACVDEADFSNEMLAPPPSGHRPFGRRHSVLSAPVDRSLSFSGSGSDYGYVYGGYGWSNGIAWQLHSPSFLPRRTPSETGTSSSSQSLVYVYQAGARSRKVALPTTTSRHPGTSRPPPSLGLNKSGHLEIDYSCSWQLLALLLNASSAQHA